MSLPSSWRQNSSGQASHRVAEPTSHYRGTRGAQQCCHVTASSMDKTNVMLCTHGRERYGGRIGILKHIFLGVNPAPVPGTRAKITPSDPKNHPL
jgi:hypothetical protein